MRTKTLLMTAAVMAAGLGASVAQTVYSVNSVGYVNKTLKAGYNLLGNPLNGTNNNINVIIPIAAGDSQILRWDSVTQHFLPADQYFDVGDPLVNGWYDAQPEPQKSTTVINPGEGFFLFNGAAGDFTITFVGEVPQGVLNNPIPANYSFKSSIVPQSVGIVSVGFPGVADMQYLGWNPVTQHYTTALQYFDVGDPLVNGFYDDAPEPNKVDPTPGVGDGFVIFNPGSAQNWNRTFSVN